MTQILRTEEKYGLTLHFHDFNQGMFAKYQKETIKASKEAFTEFNDGNGISATAEVRGESVREAIRIGILSGIEIKEVDSLKTYVVNWIAGELKKHVTTVTTEPADPNSSAQ